MQCKMASIFFSNLASRATVSNVSLAARSTRSRLVLLVAHLVVEHAYNFVIELDILTRQSHTCLIFLRKTQHGLVITDRVTISSAE